MGKPAARITDMHLCPMLTPGVPPIPHVGGPIIGPGCPTVLIGGMPAAVMGDICICVGPPDSIILGSAGVFIGGKPAARMGDSCAHGGAIILGCPTVLIGEVGTGGPEPVSADMLAFSDTRKDAESTDHFSPDVHELESPDSPDGPDVPNNPDVPIAPDVPDIPIIPINPKPVISKSSIAFTLVDDEGVPIAGENVEVTLADGTIRTLQTDANGEVLIRGIDPGTCQVSFPDIHADEWS